MSIYLCLQGRHRSNAPPRMGNAPIRSSLPCRIIDLASKRLRLPKCFGHPRSFCYRSAWPLNLPKRAAPRVKHWCPKDCWNDEARVQAGSGSACALGSDPAGCKILIARRQARLHTFKCKHPAAHLLRLCRYDCDFG